MIANNEQKTDRIRKLRYNQNVTVLDSIVDGKIVFLMRYEGKEEIHSIILTAR